MVAVPGPAGDPGGNYYLVATDNLPPPGGDTTVVAVEPFDGGIFQGSDGTLYVFGAAGNNTLEITLAAVTGTLGATPVDYAVPGASATLPATAIDVRNQAGDNTVTVDSSVSLPLAIYGGSGSDQITDSGSGDDQLVAGSGAETITYSGTGQATITPGTGNGVLSNGDLGQYVSASGQRSGAGGTQYTLSLVAGDSGHPVAGWGVDWGDGSTTTLPGGSQQVSHSYASGDAACTVTVTASGQTDQSGNRPDGACTLTLVLPPIPDLIVDGPATLTIGQPCVLSLSCANGGAAVSAWHVNWGDRTPAETWVEGPDGWTNGGGPPTLGGPSHTYVRGGLFSVTVSADGTGGGTFAAPEAVPVAVIPPVPAGLVAYADPSQASTVDVEWQPDGYDDSAQVEVSTDGVSFALPDLTNSRWWPGGLPFCIWLVNDLQPNTSYWFRAAFYNSAGRSAWCQPVTYTTGSFSLADPWTDELGLAACRTGLNYGVPVPDPDLESHDPSRYVILVNDAYGDDPTGALDNLGYHAAQAAADTPIDVADDHNLAKITLGQLPADYPYPDGTLAALTLTVTAAGANVYDAGGSLLGSTTRDSLTLSGAWLAGATIYVEASQSDADAVMAYDYYDYNDQDYYQYGYLRAETQIDLAVADIIVPNPLSYGQNLSTITDAHDLYTALGAVEFKPQVTGLTSDAIQSLNVTSEGVERTEPLVSVAATVAPPAGAVATRALVLDAENNAATPDSLLDAEVLPYDGNTVTVGLETAEDSFSQPVPCLGLWQANGPAWAYDSNFNPVGKARVIGGRGSLALLAYRITGIESDWNLLIPTMQAQGIQYDAASATVASGTIIDVSPLLAALEQRIRAEVVGAANNPKDANFPPNNYNAPVNVARSLKDPDAINGVFYIGPKTQHVVCDCVTMVMLEYARGLISQLKPGEWARMGGGGGPLTPFYLFDQDMADYDVKEPPPINSLKPGDYVRFWNKMSFPGYPNVQPGGAWGSEYTVRVSAPGTTDPLFYGFTSNGETHDSDGWRTLLQGKYNQGLPLAQQIGLSDVPGYDGDAGFLNVPKLAQMIFNLRTTPGN